MSILNGNKRDRREELQEKQHREQEMQRNLQQAAQRGDVDPDYVEMVMESELQPATAAMLSNLLSRDWVLSKMSEAEVHEMRWLSRTIADEVSSMHPPEDSIWTGDIRRYASDDPSQHLEPLNSAQQTEIFQFIQGYIARVTRSKDGFQQDTFKKQISKSEREDKSEEESAGWL